MSVFGLKTLFEQRVLPLRRAAFQKVALEVAQNNEDEFYDAWKQYRALNPAAKLDNMEGVDSETERIKKALMGSDDDEEAPCPAGPAGQAPPAAAASAATATAD